MSTKLTYQEISCTEARKIIRACVSGKITKIQAGRLKKHFKHCQKCQAYFMHQYSKIIKSELGRWINGEHVSLLQSRTVVEIEDHPSMKELVAHINGELSGAENRIITNHLNGSGRYKAQPCLHCRFIVQQLEKM